jgi:YVTN family beta-propeller protein
MQTRARWVKMLVLVVLAIGIGGVVPARKMGSTKLYVTNSLGDDITVIDLSTLKATGAIKVGKAVHGVCAQADGQELFTTVEGEKNLKVIDTATNEVTATIPLTGRPNQCASTPDGHYVGVPIRDGNSVDIVDIRQNKVVKVLPVTVPHNCFNTGNNDDMWVSSMEGHEIDRIDLKTMEYAEKIPVGGIPRPYAISKDEKTMYVALTSFHGFARVSVPDQKVVERVDLPPAPPAACELEPDTPTHGLALSPNGKELWVTSLADSGVYVYDIATKKISAEITTGKCPNWIAFSPDGKYSSVSNSASNDTSIIDTKTRQEVARVKVGDGNQNCAHRSREKTCERAFCN